VLGHAKPNHAHFLWLAAIWVSTDSPGTSQLLILSQKQAQRLAPSLPSGNRRTFGRSNSHSPTASTAPAASFKRPYQNCPEEAILLIPHRVRAVLIGSYRLSGLIVVCFGRFWTRDVPFANARHLGT
jgi:hypothetical protein